MKVSYNWLQKYFEQPLPGVQEVADALTFHSCEIEEIEEKPGLNGGDTMLDVKVLPDRAAYALSHRGIALEISAALNLALRYDPLVMEVPELPTTDKLSIEVDDAYVLRHIGAIVRGVKVGPSPAWMQEQLAVLGQRSINNVVDATNCCMLNIGQPMHAFDLSKIAKDVGDITRIEIRRAKDGEQVQVLTGEIFTLTKDMFVVGDKMTGAALDVAGLKGGLSTGVSEETTDLFISVGTYDGTTIRKMSQALKLWTDASLRYQNKISPELPPYGMRDIIHLLTDPNFAGGTLEGIVDVYPTKQEIVPVSVTLAQITGRLGAEYSAEEVEHVFDRLHLAYTKEGQGSATRYTITPPFERRDIVIPEDLAEEVGRILGYDRIVPTPLPPLGKEPNQARYKGLERIKDFLLEQGYSEISTQSFAVTGDITLANPLDQSKPSLRASLVANMNDALTRAVAVAPRVLGVAPAVQLFELGSVFTKDGEYLSLVLGYRAVSGKTKPTHMEELLGRLKDEFGIGISHAQHDVGVAEISLKETQLEKIGEGYKPLTIAQGMFKPFSLYPFALRDVAVWTPEGTVESEVALVIEHEAGDLLARIDLFDRFEKTDAETNVTRTSYAFRLVFESTERTLADTDLDPLMEKITAALNAKDGWEVR
jgi:phenylalanyl-tRNA synthetase beta chain